MMWNNTRPPPPPLVFLFLAYVSIDIHGKFGVILLSSLKVTTECLKSDVIFCEWFRQSSKNVLKHLSVFRGIWIPPLPRAMLKRANAFSVSPNYCNIE